MDSPEFSDTDAQLSLPDYLCAGLEVISIGINPSIHSATSGYPFSSPRNRFWRAFNQSNLIGRPIAPSPASLRELMHTEEIGFTDIVKKPTRGISELKASDYRLGATQLEKKLLALKPAIAWFQGMTAARYFFRYVEESRSTQLSWGLQEKSLFPFLVFVSPNPSPANAAFSFDDLVRYFNQLATVKANI